ncbi:uncharacterized protein [Musca autumnalis]|uniref:uncharacterized protein n=1 Tax=Musca autumnalis TaxID=221902 RepID=UPI003CF79D0D
MGSQSYDYLAQLATMKAYQLLTGLLVLALFYSDATLAEDEDVTLVTQIIEYCVNYTKADIIEANRNAETNWDNVTHEKKCLMLCFYRKLDLIDYMNIKRFEEIAVFMEERYEANKIRPALKQCLEIEEADACEEIYQIEMCMLKMLKDSNKKITL